MKLFLFFVTRYTVTLCAASRYGGSPVSKTNWRIQWRNPPHPPPGSATCKGSEATNTSSTSGAEYFSSFHFITSLAAALENYYKRVYTMSVSKSYRDNFSHDMNKIMLCFSCYKWNSGKKKFASRAEAKGTLKQLHFWISLKFSLVAECTECFIKKISQLKSDTRSCRCKNFSLKQKSGLIGGSGHPRPSP